MKLVGTFPATLFCLLVAAPAALPQQPNGQFEDLTRRASIALQGNPQEAAGLYRQALALRPSWAEGWFYLAASLYEISNYPESRLAFQRAAALAPDNGTVWSFLGLCEYQLADYGQALAHIQKGEALGLGDNKQFISTVRNRGALICLRSSEFGSAMEQLQPLATIGDDSPATIEAFGVTALGMPQLPADVPADRRALVQIAGRAAWAMAAQRAEEASTLFKQLLAQYPNEPGVHYLYGLYLLPANPDAAVVEFRRELQIRPEHVPARLQIANLEIKAGTPKPAMHLANEVIKLQPANVFGYITLGRASLAAGEITPAVSELETAVKLAPENAQAHFFLEQAYRRAGKTAAAEREKVEFSRLKSTQDPLSRTYGTVGSESPPTGPPR